MLFATHDAPLNAIAVTPDGTQIVGGADNGIIIWDRVTAREVRRLTGHTTPVRAIAITPTGRQIISASAGGTVRIWDRNTGEQIREPFAGHSGLTMAVTPDGNQIISGNENGELIIWDRTGSDEFGRTIPVHDGNITALAVAPNGADVISIGRHGTIGTSNIISGESRTWPESSASLDMGAQAIVVVPGASTFLSAALMAPSASGMPLPAGKWPGLSPVIPDGSKR